MTWKGGRDATGPDFTAVCIRALIYRLTNSDQKFGVVIHVRMVVCKRSGTPPVLKGGAPVHPSFGDTPLSTRPFAAERDSA